VSFMNGDITVRLHLQQPHRQAHAAWLVFSCRCARTGTQRRCAAN
jgi:hypothetical protein